MTLCDASRSCCLRRIWPSRTLSTYHRSDPHCWWTVSGSWSCRFEDLGELLDAEYRRVKMGAVPQRRYKDRFFASITAGAEERFKDLLELARTCNQPNTVVRIDQDANVVVSEVRDYLGNLTRLVRIVNRQEELVDDPEELRGIEVFDEVRGTGKRGGKGIIVLEVMPSAQRRSPYTHTSMHPYIFWLGLNLSLAFTHTDAPFRPTTLHRPAVLVFCLTFTEHLNNPQTPNHPLTPNIAFQPLFDESLFLDELLDRGLYEMTDELAMVYDYTAACFPPSYGIFNRVFQTYHVQFAVVIDVLGHSAAEGMSTQGALRVMDWVQKYMDTLRNLGVDDDLVRLPPSPLADPESMPGMVVLMDSYVGRMAKTMTEWYNRILDADLRGNPKPTADGTLCTLGAIDFFRMLSQQVSIIEALNDHGEVMFQTARTALDVMRGFQETQREILAGPGGGGGGAGLAGGRPMSLEMAVAFINNNVTCYDQSLQFADDVQVGVEVWWYKVRGRRVACPREPICLDTG
ncbi:hypothetical protein Vretifemale_17874 [Volvox reticuliferus]|uniref:Uncharacterized protein n=1 Tax=Volvox reticuliferus TaxID=1737510 RepID=A0A8J4CYH1_9CHLO|nr:hypothetical protein Vretifemale_17874 [Volvox reticuliferus]